MVPEKMLNYRAIKKRISKMSKIELVSLLVITLRSLYEFSRVNSGE